MNEKRGSSPMKTQMQLFYEAGRKISDGHSAFMEMITHPTNPLTSNDLRKLIAKRPELYGKYSGFIDNLPSDKVQPQE